MDVLGLGVFDQIILRKDWVSFDLVDSWNDTSCLDDTFQHWLSEVGDTDRGNSSLLLEFNHGFPGLEKEEDIKSVPTLSSTSTNFLLLTSTRVVSVSRAILSSASFGKNLSSPSYLLLSKKRLEVEKSLDQKKSLCPTQSSHLRFLFFLTSFLLTHKATGQ